MFVNDIDISTFKAELIDRDIQTVEVTIYDDWLRNSLNPLYLGKQEKFKAIKLQFQIEDTDDESSLNDISDLIKQFIKCVIKFEDIDLSYNCTIANKEHKRLSEGLFELSVELRSGYAYKTAVNETMDHVASQIINVTGNLPSPAVVSVMVPIDTISLTLAGFGDDDITINNLLADVPVIIDGEACTVMQNGQNKFDDVELWNFPVLQPGENTITSSISDCVITITYKPKYI